MMYDLAAEPPPSGSLLESLFLIVAKRRQEAQFLSTKLILEGVREAHVEQSGVADTFKAYLDAMFPYLEAETVSADEDAKKMLDKWTSKVALRVKPIWRAQDNKGLVSKLRRGAERVKQGEALRRKYRHRRI